MPRNSSGVYSLPAGNPVITGTTITSTWANTTMPDLGNEITNSLDRAGRGSMTGQFKATDGTQAAPGISFSSEPSSGIFRNAAGDWRLGVLNTLVATLTATGMSASMALGAVGTPSLSFMGDPNTGIYSPSADQVAIAVGGAQGLVVTATGVGAGTAPTYKLDINSGATTTAGRFASSDANSVIVRFATGSTVDRGYIGAGSSIFTGGVNTEFGLDAVTTLVLSTGSTKRVTVSSTGAVTVNAPSSGTAFTVSGLVKVGTGVAAPTSGQLMINNPNATATRLQLFQDSQESWAIGMNASSTVLRFQASGVDALTITNTNLATFAGTTQIATTNSGLPAATGGGLFFDYSTSISRTYIGDGTGYNWKWSKRTGSATTDYFTIFDDGRFAGHALHNNAGAVTGTTNQYIASGTYTPTFTALLNVASTGSPSGFWVRVGNVVVCFVTGTIDPTAAAGTITTMGVSLPIASNLTGNDLIGVTVHDQGGNSELLGLISADITNDRGQVQYFPTDTASRGFGAVFGYIIA